MKTGELWLIDPRTPPGPRAVVCVLEAGDSAEPSPLRRSNGENADRSASENLVSVLFTDSELEAATDADLCYAAGEAAPWTVRVCCDLIGPVRAVQFVRLLGALPAISDNVLLDASWGEFAPDLASRRGSPLRGPEDPRWGPRKAQLEEAQRYWIVPFDDPD